MNLTGSDGDRLLLKNEHWRISVLLADLDVLSISRLPLPVTAALQFSPVPDKSQLAGSLIKFELVFSAPATPCTAAGTGPKYRQTSDPFHGSNGLRFLNKARIW